MFCALLGCKHSVTPGAIKAQDEAKLQQLDVEWNKAAAARSVDGWVSFYADDAVVLPPNEKTADTSRNGVSKPMTSRSAF